jgi:hypothetical protein
MGKIAQLERVGGEYVSNICLGGITDTHSDLDACSAILSFLQGWLLNPPSVQDGLGWGSEEQTRLYYILGIVKETINKVANHEG